jgi:hypothetical protein
LGDFMTTVECYAGSTYPEQPRAFTWQGRHHTITHVRRQWRERASAGERSEELVFVVEVEGGRVFTLRYAPATESWEISPLEQFT